MMKFYQADSESRHRLLPEMDRKTALGTKQSEAGEDKRIYLYVMAIFNEELSEPWLYKFVHEVDKKHYNDS